MMRSCIAEESLLGVGIVHSNRGAPEVSSAIGILCTASSRTAEVLIATEPASSQISAFCLRVPSSLSGATQDQLKHCRLICAADRINRPVGIYFYLFDPPFGCRGRCWIPPNDF